MTTLSKDEVLRLTDAAGFNDEFAKEYVDFMTHFAALCRADLVAENETLRYEVDAIAEIKQERDALKAQAAKDAAEIERLNNKYEALRSVMRAYEQQQLAMAQADDEVIAALKAQAAKDAADAELGRVAMRFVDRAGDVHPGIDDAETICADFYKAMWKALDMKRGEA